ncbi:MAG: DUF2892 domain-containing protein [Pseudomonadota bacterium]
MTINMGTFDRGGRLVIAAMLTVLAFGTNVIGGGVLFWLALAIAAIFTATAFVGNCPLYRIVGLRTCRNC